MEMRGVGVVLRYDALCKMRWSRAPSNGGSMPASGTAVANVYTRRGLGLEQFEMKGGGTVQANVRGVLLAKQ